MKVNLQYANLQDANLWGAILPLYKILPEEGSFVAWKKTTKGVIKILIPEDAKRVSNLVGRKCRTDKIIVLEGPGCGGTGPNYPGIAYNKGKVVTATLNEDIRVDCTEGIHFFLTKEEAEQW